jgi:hypothetical protein
MGEMGVMGVMGATGADLHLAPARGPHSDARRHFGVGMRTSRHRDVEVGIEVEVEVEGRLRVEDPRCRGIPTVRDHVPALARLFAAHPNVWGGEGPRATSVGELPIIAPAAPDREVTPSALVAPVHHLSLHLVRVRVQCPIPLTPDTAVVEVVLAHPAVSGEAAVVMILGIAGRGPQKRSYYLLG